MKKKLLCTLMLTGVMSVSAFAAPEMAVDNNVIENSDIVAIEGTDYFPVRTVAEALGLDVEWQADTKTVIVSNGGPIYITFKIGENGYTFARTAPMESTGAPVIIEGKTYIPVDVISDIAGFEVEKNEKGYNVVLPQNEAEDITSENHPPIIIDDNLFNNTETPSEAPSLTATGVVAEVNEEQILFNDDVRGEVLLNKSEGVIVTDSEGNSVDINDIKVDDKLTVEYNEAMTMSLPPINNPKSIIIMK